MHPDGKRTLDKIGETQRIATAYDEHLKRIDLSRPRQKRRPSQRQRNFAASTKSEPLSMPVHGSTAETQPNGCTTTASLGKRKRQEEEANADSNTKADEADMAIATVSGDPGAVPSPTSMAAPSDPPPVTEPAPSVKFNFYLHRPYLRSRHPVLIPLPSDAELATSLTNRTILEFPTLYVLHSQPDGKLPEGYVSEEEFSATAKKELIEEIPGEGPSIGGIDGFGGNVKGKAYDLEDGEVDEGRLLQVLGKDLKGFAGSL